MINRSKKAHDPFRDDPLYVGMKNLANETGLTLDEIVQLRKAK